MLLLRANRASCRSGRSISSMSGLPLRGGIGAGVLAAVCAVCAVCADATPAWAGPGEAKSGDAKAKSGAKQTNPPRFMDEAVQRGIIYRVPFYGGVNHTFGRGVGFADLNGNGFQDLILLGDSGGKVGVFRNNGSGVFSNLTSLVGIPNLPGASGVSFADYDGDGDMDIFITMWTEPDRLFRNNGDFTFTDVTAQAGLGDTGAGAGSAWADITGNGWLDLYVANRNNTFRRSGQGVANEPNRLYINQGDGTFIESAHLWGCASYKASFHGTFFDYDNDGDMDLYVAEDKGIQACADTGMGIDTMYRNEGGYFVDVASEIGTLSCLDAMCATVADFNSSGYMDLYVTNTPQGNAFYVNNGDGTFTNLAQEYGVMGFHVGWGSVFFDATNDGVMELYVCSETGANPLFSYRGELEPMVDLAPALGLADTGPSYCLAVADIDNNGSLDIVMMNAGNQNTRLFINRATEGRNWIQIEALGPWPNTKAIGAVVETLVDGKWRRDQVLAGNGYKSQSQLPRHFGLGESPVLESLRITWPDGHTRVLNNLPANAQYTFRRCPADLNTDGVLTFDDFSIFATAYTTGVKRNADLTSASAFFPGMPGYGVPDGIISPADFVSFAMEYSRGCPD